MSNEKIKPLNPEKVQTRKVKLIIFSLCILLALVLVMRYFGPENGKIVTATTSTEKILARNPQSVATVQKRESISSDVLTNALKNDDQKEKERADYFAKYEACEKYIEDIVRPERENFKKKFISSVAGDIGDWFFNGQNPPTNYHPFSRTDKFYRAVAAAGVLEKVKTVHFSPDKKMALSLVDEIIVDDPSNSAGYLLKAYIYDSMGKNDEARQILALAEQRTDHYDTHMLALNRKSSEIVNGAADMLVYQEMYIPLFQSSRALIRTIGKYKKFSLAEQIMKLASDDSKLLPELEWSSSDYQSAKYVLENIIPGKKFLDHVEVDLEKFKVLAQQFPEFGVMAAEFDPKKKSLFLHDCGIGQLEYQVALYKKALARSK